MSSNVASGVISVQSTFHINHIQMVSQSITDLGLDVLHSVYVHVGGGVDGGGDGGGVVVVVVAVALVVRMELVHWNHHRIWKKIFR